MKKGPAIPLLFSKGISMGKNHKGDLPEQAEHSSHLHRNDTTVPRGATRMANWPKSHLTSVSQEFHVLSLTHKGLGWEA